MDSINQITTLVSTQNFDEASAIADKFFPTCTSLKRGFITSLFRDIPEEDPIRDCHIRGLARLLRVIVNTAPVDDVVFELIDASSGTCDATIFFLTVHTFMDVFKNYPTELYLDWCLSFMRSTIPKLVNAQEYLLEAYVYSSLKTSNSNFLTLFTPMTQNVKCLFSANILYFLSSELPEQYFEMFSNALHFDPFYLLPSFNARTKCSNHTRTCSLLDRNLVPDIAYGLYVHHAFTEGFFVPQVYSPSFLIVGTLPFTNMLLSDSCKKEKLGLELLITILGNRQNLLGKAELSPVLESVLCKLNTLMLYDEDKKLRETALKVFVSLLDAFHQSSQYLILMKYRKFVTHSGTLALLLQRIKNNAFSCVEFNNERLIQVIREYHFLKIETSSLLIDHIESALSWLNIIIFLIAQKTKFDIHLLFPDLVVNYLNPLKEMIQDSLLSCSQALFGIETDKDEKVGNIDFSVNLELPPMSKMDKTNSIVYKKWNRTC